MDNVVGIDVSTGKGKTALAVLSTRGRKPALVFLGERSEYRDNDVLMGVVMDFYPRLVAIDAPLTLPLGRCCLRSDCSCRFSVTQKGRASERILAAEGIPIYFPTAWISDLVDRGLELAESCRRLGLSCIEAYPYATKMALFGRLPKKSTWEGRKRLQMLMASLVESVPGGTLLSHDQLDSLVTAYTGYLHLKRATRVVGDPKEGVIYVPKKAFKDSQAKVKQLQFKIRRRKKQPTSPQMKSLQRQKELKGTRDPEQTRLRQIALREGLYVHGVLASIKCVDCGKERVVNMQNRWQVKRCKSCQSLTSN